jgi:hypothetical protein
MTAESIAHERQQILLLEFGRAKEANSVISFTKREGT